MTIEIVTVPCRTDNYAFLVQTGGRTALVDAPEAAPISAELDRRGWSLEEIWLTHHHGDHTEAVEELKAEYGATVTGAAADAHRLRMNRMIVEVMTRVVVWATAILLIGLLGLAVFMHS